MRESNKVIVIGILIFSMVTFFSIDSVDKK